MKKKSYLFTHLLFVGMIVYFVLNFGEELFLYSKFREYEVMLLSLVVLIILYASFYCIQTLLPKFIGILAAVAVCFISMNFISNYISNELISGTQYRQLYVNKEIYSVSINTMDKSMEDEFDSILREQPEILLNSSDAIYMCDEKVANHIMESKSSNILAFTKGKKVYMIEDKLSAQTLTHELAHAYQNKYGLKNEALWNSLYKKYYKNNDITYNFDCAGNTFNDANEFFAECTSFYYYQNDILSSQFPDIANYLNYEYN